MEYTTKDMLRDLKVPIAIAVVFCIGWLAISAAESSTTGQPFWSCVFHFACGVHR